MPTSILPYFPALFRCLCPACVVWLRVRQANRAIILKNCPLRSGQSTNKVFTFIFILETQEYRIRSRFWFDERIVATSQFMTGV